MQTLTKNKKLIQTGLYLLLQRFFYEHEFLIRNRRKILL